MAALTRLEETGTPGRIGVADTGQGTSGLAFAGAGRAYDAGVKATRAAFGAPGAQERILKLRFGELPGAVFMRIATNDVFTDGWDPARATGQSTDLDPELAAELLAQARAFASDDFRGADGEAPFAAPVEPPASASAADKLAASLGRQP